MPEEMNPEWTRQAEHVAALRESLRGMLESYDLLVEQAESHFKNATLQGVVMGAFVGEIARARDVLSRSASPAPGDDARDAARWRAIRPHLSVDYCDSADTLVDLFMDDFMDVQPAATCRSVEDFVDAIIAGDLP